MIRSKLIVNGKRKSWISKADLSTVLVFIKKKMAKEEDEFKKQAWAEVGLELNGIYLHLGIRQNQQTSRKFSKATLGK